MQHAFVALKILSTLGFVGSNPCSSKSNVLTKFYTRLGINDYDYSATLCVCNYIHCMNILYFSDGCLHGI